MKGTGRTFHIEVATVGITLVASIIGAVLMFSTLLDSKTVGGIIEKLGNAESIKWVITILLALFTGFAVKRSLDYKSKAEKKLREEEDKKFESH